MRKNFLNTKWMNMLYAPLFLLLIASMAVTSVNADPPYMFVDPPMAEISAPGESVTIKINVSNVINCYGFEFWLAYNSTLLTKTGITVDGPGQVTPTDPGFRAGDDLSLVGVVRYSLAFCKKLNPSPPPDFLWPDSFNGSGTLVWITFQGTTNETLLPATSDLNFTRAKLYTPLGSEITTDPPVDGEILVIPEFPAAIALPLLLIATLAATSLGKILWSRKRQSPATT